MADESAELIDPFELFSEEIRTPVEGLAYLGQLTEKIEFCGHSFVIRTLLPQDKLAISAVLQPYRNTILEVDAYSYAHIGAALVSIDNDDNFCPAIGPDIQAFISGRLNWLSKNLYPPVTEFLYTQYKLIEQKAEQAIIELDRLSKGSQPTNLPPWLDSWIASGSSPEETDSDTPQSIPSSEDS